VRELRFAVERANLLAEGATIELADLPPEIIERERSAAAVVRGEAAVSLSGNENDGPDPARVRAALEQAHWRRGKAAEFLGVSPRTLHRWMKHLGL
jgi:transcriptional regulator of acetoin/glycerol metabolism